MIDYEIETRLRALERARFGGGSALLLIGASIVFTLFVLMLLLQTGHACVPVGDVRRCVVTEAAP